MRVEEMIDDTERRGKFLSSPLWKGPTVFDMLRRTHYYMVVSILIMIANAIVIIWAILNGGS